MNEDSVEQTELEATERGQQDPKEFFASLWYTVPGTLALVYATYTWIWPTYAGPSTLAGRISFSLQCAFFAFLPTVATALTVVFKRLADGIYDPLRGYESRQIRIHGRTLDNNILHFVWFAICSLALSTRLENAEMRILPILTGVFIAARFVYWWGFNTGVPVRRAPGAQITLTVNIGLILGTAYIFAVRGVS